MKKEDLKAGMGVELRNGQLCVLVPSKDKLCLLYHGAKRVGWASSLPDYNNSLAHTDFLEYDIMKVYDLSDVSPFFFEKRELLWEREPEIKLTNEEIEILKALKVLGMKLIGRDKDGSLNAFDACYLGFDEELWLRKNIVDIPLQSRLFSFITYKKPYSINQLLKGVK
jgi:hypothetical protein